MAVPILTLIVRSFRCVLERGKFQESPSRIYGAHTLVFQAQISNFIAFGPEMAQRNGLKVFCLDWPFLHFSLILRLKSGSMEKIRPLSLIL